MPVRMVERIKDSILGAMTLTKDGKTEYLTKEELELGYRSKPYTKRRTDCFMGIVCFLQRETPKRLKKRCAI